MTPTRNIALVGSALLFAVPSALALAAESSDALPDALTEALADALEAGWKGEKVCELMHEDENIRALRCTFPPGVGHERHYHLPHFGYVLQGGAMRITDSSGEHEASGPAGGTWESDGVPWHEAVNIGDTTAQYLILEKKY